MAAQKPRFVLIGEAHPSNLEMMLRLNWIFPNVMAEYRAASGVKMRHHLKELSSLGKYSLKSLTSIIKEQTDILKKEGIRRLFIEEPHNQRRVRIFEGYRKDHDFKRLRAEHMDASIEDELELNIKCCRTIASSNVISGYVKRAYYSFFPTKKKDMGPMVFSTSHCAVAYRAGISDILPVDPSRDALFLDYLHCLFLSGRLFDVAAKITREFPGQTMQAMKELCAFSYAIEKLAEGNGVFAEKRDLGMYSLIRETNEKDGHRVPSALICGNEHAEALKSSLSETYDVKVYRTGQKQHSEILHAIDEAKRANNR